MPGRVLTDSVVEIVNDLNRRTTALETYGWVIPNGGALTVKDSNKVTRIIIGLMSDGKTGIRIYDSSSVLQFDQAYT